MFFCSSICRTTRPLPRRCSVTPSLFLGFDLALDRTPECRIDRLVCVCAHLRNLSSPLGRPCPDCLSPETLAAASEPIKRFRSAGDEERVSARGTTDDASADEVSERLVHRLHAFLGAGLDHGGELEGLPLADQVAHRGVATRISTAAARPLPSQSSPGSARRRRGPTRRAARGSARCWSGGKTSMMRSIVCAALAGCAACRTPGGRSRRR